MKMKQHYKFFEIFISKYKALCPLLSIIKPYNYYSALTIGNKAAIIFWQIPPL